MRSSSTAATLRPRQVFPLLPPSLLVPSMLVLSILVLSILVLAGCGGSSGSTRTEPVTQPSASGPTATTTTSEPPAPSTPPVPASCAGLSVVPGTKLTGAAVGTCWTDALYAYDSFHEYVLSGGDAAETDVQLHPALAVSGTTLHSHRPFRFVDGVLYELRDGAWIKGDPDSTDHREAVLGSTAALIKATADPKVIATAITGCGTWQVDQERALVSLQDGKDRPGAVRLTCSATPFSLQGVHVTESILWVGEDWTPLKLQGTADAGGTSVTTSQEFYDLGRKLSITAPLP